MFDLFSGLPLAGTITLLLALFFVLAYEFINGFHDTANAVATVIYTKAMPANLAVFASGVFNFLGVMMGGLGVAYAIVHLLPVELILNVASSHGLVMVFALLSSAILWNFGTWYIGLPASSSHTLIGSILGVGLAHALMNGIPMSQGINVDKAIGIMLSLVISPTVGLVIAGITLLLLKRFRRDSRMHLTPDERKAIDGKKHPPFWTRTALIASAMSMSFAHGSNDGQKGIGLLMLVLIGLAPTQFVLDMSNSPYQISRTRDAAIHMAEFYEKHHEAIAKNGLRLQFRENTQTLPKAFACSPETTTAAITRLSEKLDGVSTYAQIQDEDRREVRRMLLCLDNTAKKVESLKDLPASEKADLKKLRQDLVMPIEYAPQWAIVLIALALGLGTMIGWKRIVLTVGEKIGQKGMTYAQGMAAQITASLAIGIASLTGMPVSTTHVLSSAVAGTMIANRSGLQGGTVRNILLAWIFTLPATILLSGGLFWIASHFF